MQNKNFHFRYLQSMIIILPMILACQQSSDVKHKKGDLYVQYFSNSIVYNDTSRSTQSEPQYMLMFNMGEKETDVKWTLYFEDQDPVTLSFPVDGEKTWGTELLSMKEIPQFKPFGGKIESSEPVVVQMTTGIFNNSNAPVHSNPMIFSSFICSETLANKHAYADGVYVEDETVIETERIHILNPNKEAAKVTFNAYFAKYTKTQGNFTREYKVQPERILIIPIESVVKNELTNFGSVFTSNIPVLIQVERILYDKKLDKRIAASYRMMTKQLD